MDRGRRVRDRVDLRDKTYEFVGYAPDRAESLCVCTRCGAKCRTSVSGRGGREVILRENSKDMCLCGCLFVSRVRRVCRAQVDRKQHVCCELGSDLVCC